MEEFERFFKQEGGGLRVHWAGSGDDEDATSKRFETTVRCIFRCPINSAGRRKAKGTAILTGKPSQQRVIMAKAYKPPATSLCRAQLPRAQPLKELIPCASSPFTRTLLRAATARKRQPLARDTRTTSVCIDTLGPGRSSIRTK